MFRPTSSCVDKGIFQTFCYQRGKKKKIKLIVKQKKVQKHFKTNFDDCQKTKMQSVLASIGTRQPN